MTFDREFFTSSTGQVLMVGVVLFLGAFAVRWQHESKAAPALPKAKPAPAVPLPRTMTREVAKFSRPAAPVATMPLATEVVPLGGSAKPAPREMPLVLFSAQPAIVSPAAVTAPFGRLIPCETVVALESNRLETPIIGLVTEGVWHDGRLVIPAGAEVHGRAVLDRARERLAAQSGWRIVWRTRDADNGLELATEGIVLEREFDPTTGTWGELDGSAGLRGQVIRTDGDRELQLFAATFLGTATAALQDTRPTMGLLGESSVPMATARNAVLAGAGAILRERAQQLREAIDRDGFYLRVPSGHAFYLYTTATLDRSQARRALARDGSSNRP